MFTWVLGHSVPSSLINISTQTFQSADGVGGHLREEKECLFSSVTHSGRVWRKVPESDAQSVRGCATTASYATHFRLMAPCTGSKPRLK